jgi:hypothetical protein
MRQSEVLTAAGKYLAQNPEELLRVVRNAAALKLGVPLAALRWFAARGRGRAAPRDVIVEAVPPGIRIGATLEVMSTRLRVSSVVFIDRVRLSADELRFELRFNDTSLTLLDSSASPLAALIQSGALDLAKLGNLVAVMPKRPAYLIEAKGDKIVVDLKRHPALSSARAELLLRLVTPVVTVTGVAAGTDHLDLTLALFEKGVRAAVDAFFELL